MWTLLTACRYQTGLTFATRKEAREAAQAHRGMGYVVARAGMGIA